MSYPKDLDEYTTEALLEELAIRRARQEMDRCGYCGRDTATKPCRFPERHKVLLKKEARL